jgi:hypothetical protein
VLDSASEPNGRKMSTKSKGERLTEIGHAITVTVWTSFFLIFLGFLFYALVIDR